MINSASCCCWCVWAYSSKAHFLIVLLTTGSGQDEEDQYMYMVVANLLQKQRKTYMSVVRGGYQSLLEYLDDVSLNLSEWIVGSKHASASKAAKDHSRGLRVVSTSNLYVKHVFDHFWWQRFFFGGDFSILASTHLEKWFFWCCETQFQNVSNDQQFF